MTFAEIFREERYYCNHLFRLLCYKKEDGGSESGLGAILSELGLSTYATPENINHAQIYTEVAAFRDAFAAEQNKNDYINKVYELFLPIISLQYNGKIQNPIVPSDVRAKIGLVHPRDYAKQTRDFALSEQDTLFYREFSALFNAKPDFLIVVGDKMMWFEAKFKEAFSTEQLRRTQNIANLCSSELFEKFFQRRESMVILLGSEYRHKKAQSIDHTRFLSWEKCYDISMRLLPGGESNYTSASFKQMLSM
jgi:hypothetical protein